MPILLLNESVYAKVPSTNSFAYFPIYPLDSVLPWPAGSNIWG